MGRVQTQADDDGGLLDICDQCGFFLDGVPNCGYCGAPKCPICGCLCGDSGEVWEPDDDDDATYPPVSGGALDMDADETACGALCQDLNDRMWAKLGPVDDVELPF